MKATKRTLALTCAILMAMAATACGNTADDADVAKVDSYVTESTAENTADSETADDSSAASTTASSTSTTKVSTSGKTSSKATTTTKKTGTTTSKAGSTTTTKRNSQGNGNSGNGNSGNGNNNGGSNNNYSNGNGNSNNNGSSNNGNSNNGNSNNNGNYNNGGNNQQTQAPQTTTTQKPTKPEKPTTTTAKPTTTQPPQTTQPPEQTNWVDELNSVDRAYYNFMANDFSDNDWEIIKNDMENYVIDTFQGKSGNVKFYCDGKYFYPNSYEEKYIEIPINIIIMDEPKGGYEPGTSWDNDSIESYEDVEIFKSWVYAKIEGTVSVQAELGNFTKISPDDTCGDAPIGFEWIMWAGAPVINVLYG